MRNILQLLRLYSTGVSKLQISKQLGLSRNTVKKLFVIDSSTGEIQEVEVFICILGASG